MRSIQNIITDSKRYSQIDHHKTTITLDLNKQKLSLRETRKTRTKCYHRHDVGYKAKLENSNKRKLSNANATRSIKTIQELNKNRDRHKIHKIRQVLTRPNKTSDMNNKLYISMYNKLYISMYIKTITEETNQNSNEKHSYGKSIQNKDNLGC